MIVEDHRLFADAITLTLEDMGMEVVAVSASGDDAVETIRIEEPDLVLLDLGLPDRSGLAIGREILEERPQTKVVALTAVEDEDTVSQSIRAGFAGYLSKTLGAPQFRRSLECIVEGQVVTPKAVVPTNKHLGSIEGIDDIEGLVTSLTARERQVLTLLVDGATSQDIADRLSMSRHTVRTHVQNIHAKLQVHTRLQAAAFAIRHGLVSKPTTQNV